MPSGLSLDQLALEHLKYKDEIQVYVEFWDEHQMTKRTALHLQNVVTKMTSSQPWPSLPSELDENYMTILSEVTEFLTTFVGGTDKSYDFFTS